MPNFGGSRLGFWSLRGSTPPIPPTLPAGPKRSDTRKKIVIVYNEPRSGDLLPVYVVGNNIEFPYKKMWFNSTYPCTQAGLVAIMNFWLKELGSLYSDIIIYKRYEELIANPPVWSNVMQLWDLDYAGTNTTSRKLTGSLIYNLYNNYLIGGGAIALLGEDTYNNARNRDMVSFIQQIGGGTVDITTDTYVTVGQWNFNQEFAFLPSSTVFHNQPMTFNTYASRPNRLSKTPATKITYRPTQSYNSDFAREVEDKVVSAVWKKGTIPNAPNGTLLTVFDSTFISDVTTRQDPQPIFFKNLVLTLDYK